MQNINIKSFLIGFALGLVLLIIMSIYLTVKRVKERKSLLSTNKKLKNTIADKMDIESEGLSNLKEENAKLKKENENLRVSLKVSMQGSGSKELMRAETLQRAVDKLLISTPGFGSAWGVALQEAEAETEEIYEGKKPFIKKIFSSSSYKAKPAIESKAPKEE